MRNKFGQKISQVSSFWSTLDNNKLIIGALFVLLIILLIVGIVYKDKFANILYGPDRAKLKELDVIFFMSPSCHHCKEMKAILESEGTIGDFTTVDVNTEEGAKMAKMYGATKGVPTFVSKTNKNGTVGKRNSTADILKELQSIQISEVPQQVPQVPQQVPQVPQEITADLVKDLDIIIVTSETCGYCQKLKEDIDILGFSGVITQLDLSSPETEQALRDFNVDSTKGVPIIVSRRTGKSTIGYKPFASITKDLMNV